MTAKLTKLNGLYVKVVQIYTVGGKNVTLPRSDVCLVFICFLVAPRGT